MRIPQLWEATTAVVAAKDELHEAWERLRRFYPPPEGKDWSFTEDGNDLELVDKEDDDDVLIKGVDW